MEKINIKKVHNEIDSVRSELERMKKDEFTLMRVKLLDYIERDFKGWTHMYGLNPEESDNGGIVVGFFLDVRDILTSSNKEIFDRIDLLRLIGRIR